MLSVSPLLPVTNRWRKCPVTRPWPLGGVLPSPAVSPVIQTRMPGLKHHHQIANIPIIRSRCRSSHDSMRAAIMTLCPSECQKLKVDETKYGYNSCSHLLTGGRMVLSAPGLPRVRLQAGRHRPSQVIGEQDWARLCPLPQGFKHSPHHHPHCWLLTKWPRRYTCGTLDNISTISWNQNGQGIRWRHLYQGITAQLNTPWAFAHLVSP